MQAGFTGKRGQNKGEDDQSQLIDKLYRQIGKLSTECEWIKKNLKCFSSDQRRFLIDNGHELSVCRQCELLELSRTKLYYKPKPLSDAKLAVINKVDEIYTEHPYFGSRRMVVKS